MTTDGTQTPAAQTPADRQPTEDLGTTAVLTAPEPQPQRAQAPYGTPPAPSVATPAPSTPFSLTSLILGVTSVFFGLTVIAPVAGLVFGILGLRREPAGRTLAIWGIVLNAVMTGIALLIVVGLLFFGLLIPFIALVSGSDYR
ncbi:DUF4190 domain-containing protein [Rathayibacter sp. VKM Ac-2759]|uniref:DUF4190 domain-containing protein n=1 Tax=Rathayibacter sp. VKM Ac-2759 TaxID=2609252 RepID=UPI001ABEAF95|nr:DUF4190 domain-containing protein [Rathayibacter sp. VKM Ac-2759]